MNRSENLPDMPGDAHSGQVGGVAGESAEPLPYYMNEGLLAAAETNAPLEQRLKAMRISAIRAERDPTCPTHQRTYQLMEESVAEILKTAGVNYIPEYPQLPERPGN